MSFSWDSFFFQFQKTRLLIKVDDKYIFQIIAMSTDLFKIFSYYGSNPVALKDIHIHMYFFCIRRCRRPVAAADVNFLFIEPGTIAGTLCLLPVSSLEASAGTIRFVPDTLKKRLALVLCFSKLFVRGLRITLVYLSIMCFS